MPDVSLTYPIDWTGLEDFSEYHFDDNGLPQVDYGPATGLKYNAITISQFGLYHFAQWEKHDTTESKRLALVCADWLLANARPWHHDISAWIMDFKLPLYGPQPPWISGMAQGEAVSLLLRAHIVTGKTEYLEMTHQAIKAFDYPAKEHGVVDYLADGSPVFQEYPALPAPHVLNGFVFALIGVLEYAWFTGNQKYQTLAEQAAASILDHWRRWDLGYWTRYDLYKIPRPASTMYHELHIRQMLALHILLDNERYAQIARRWQRMQKGIVNHLLRISAKVVEKALLHGGGLY